jgi:hypothetical protein
MSVRVTWCRAYPSSAELLVPGEEAPDGQYAEEYTLIVGGNDPLAIVGTCAELEDWCREALATVRGEA